MVSPSRYFNEEEVARATSYHRPLYWAGAAGLVLDAGALALLAWSSVGDAQDPASLPWAARAAVDAVAVVAVLTLVGLPLGFATGFLRERRWGFSTQELSSWIGDQVKGFLVNAVLAAAAFVGVVAVARALAGWWAVPVAAGLAALAFVLSFLAPIVLEPLFNRYAPLGDEALLEALRRLAVRAGVPVRDVLVQDASRRTRKANAYVSGLGRTRRVVVSDTLLEEASPGEVQLVVAHELGHRRHRHVAVGTALLMAVTAVTVLVVWAALGTQAVSYTHLTLPTSDLV